MAYEKKDMSGTLEEWREVEGAPSYEVSNLGRVRRAKGGKSTSAGRILSNRPRKKNGYIPVVLSLGARGQKRQAHVHQLVAEAFCGPRPSVAHCAAHNDGNSANNKAENLRWATHAENMHDMSFEVHGTASRGQAHYNSVLTEELVIELRKARAQNPYGGVAQICRKHGLNRKGASDAARGATWKHLEIEHGV